MAHPGRYRQVSNHSVSAQVWHEIEWAYKTQKKITFSGEQWIVKSISRMFLASGESAVASLEKVAEVD